ncbi:MAG: hypothetical protein M3Y78_15445, partial [Pseudomonadota bacterium]|nr:hypothetical protein [Pseudomonadota bacterium]
TSGTAFLTEVAFLDMADIGCVETADAAIDMKGCREERRGEFIFISRGRSERTGAAQDGGRLVKIVRAAWLELTISIPKHSRARIAALRDAAAAADTQAGGRDLARAYR